VRERVKKLFSKQSQIIPAYRQAGVESEISGVSQKSPEDILTNLFFVIDWYKKSAPLHSLLMVQGNGVGI
jgi:hypothetical protein